MYIRVSHCNKCFYIFRHSGSKPISPVRLTNCGHSFCFNCIMSAMKCAKCEVPMQPRETSPDHLLSSLIQNCDTIAKIIGKRSETDFDFL